MNDAFTSRAIRPRWATCWSSSTPEAEREAPLAVIGAVVEPEEDRVLLEAVLRSVSAGVARDHVGRLDGGAGAVAAQDGAVRVGLAHGLLERGVADDEHADVLVPAEDVKPVNVGGDRIWGERLERPGLERLGADLDVVEDRGAGLGSGLHRVAGGLDLRAPRIGEGRVLLSETVGDRVRVDAVREVEDDDADVPGGVVRGRGAREALEREAVVTRADGDRGPEGRVRCARR